MHDIDIFYETHAENLFRYKWSHCGWWETQPGYHRWIISFWLFEQRIYCFRKNRNSVKSNKYLFVFILVQLLHIRNYVNGSHFFAFTELFSFFSLSLVKHLASMHRYVGAWNPHDNNWIDNSNRSFKTKFMANCLPHFSSLMNRNGH